MALHLVLENETTLPDGGPVSLTVTGRRSVDIGRDQHLDWTLPDPSRFISGKHCEIHYRDGGYWLHDVSTNGTFLNGADQRMRGPHRLRSGDRLMIGHYIVNVMLDTEAAPGPREAERPAVPTAASPESWWSDDGGAPPPIDPRQLKTPAEAPRPVRAEFLDWAAGVPAAEPVAPVVPLPPQPLPYARPGADMDWAQGDIARPPPPPPAPERPAPRRPAAGEAAMWEEARPVPPAAPSPFSETPVNETPFRETPVREAPVRETSPQPSPLLAADGGDFLRALAHHAGVPPELLLGRPNDEVAEQLGRMLRIAIDGVMQLLQARHQAKQMTRSASHTTIQATENNPLKFSPGAEEALRIMFGPPTRSYLGGPDAFAQSFRDLKDHQLKTYMALQHALTRLLAGLDPEAIAGDTKGEGVAALLGSRKAKSWDIFVERWNAAMLRDAGGPLTAFMLHFSDYYDREPGGGG